MSWLIISVVFVCELMISPCSGSSSNITKYFCYNEAEYNATVCEDSTALDGSFYSFDWENYNCSEREYGVAFPSPGGGSLAYWADECCPGSSPGSSGNRPGLTRCWRPDFKNVCLHPENYVGTARGFSNKENTLQATCDAYFAWNDQISSVRNWTNFDCKMFDNTGQYNSGEGEWTQLFMGYATSSSLEFRPYLDQHIGGCCSDGLSRCAGEYPGGEPLYRHVCQDPSTYTPDSVAVRPAPGGHQYITYDCHNLFHNMPGIKNVDLANFDCNRVDNPGQTNGSLGTFSMMMAYGGQKQFTAFTDTTLGYGYQWIEMGGCCGLTGKPKCWPDLKVKYLCRDPEQFQPTKVLGPGAVLWTISFSDAVFNGTLFNMTNPDGSGTMKNLSVSCEQGMMKLLSTLSGGPDALLDPRYKNNSKIHNLEASPAHQGPGGTGFDCASANATITELFRQIAAVDGCCLDLVDLCVDPVTSIPSGAMPTSEFGHVGYLRGSGLWLCIPVSRLLVLPFGGIFLGARVRCHDCCDCFWEPCVFGIYPLSGT